MAYRFPSAGIEFLRELGENNNKEWFHRNKARYERDLKGPARDLVAAVNEALSAIAPNHVTPPAKAVNRINRDIRFSKDKSPYNTRIWAGFPDQTKPRGASAGFYFGFSADSCGVGAGVWQPDKDRLALLRAHFAAHHRRYFALAEEQRLGDTFPGNQSPRLKRVPPPYPADHPAADLLKLKGIHLSVELDPGLVTSPDLVPTVARHFRQLAPLVSLLDEALGG